MAHMTIRDMSFNTNNQIELVATADVTAGSPLTLVAENPKEIFNPTTKNVDSYAFLFWNVDGKIITTPTASATTPTPDKPNFICSAWYIQTGGGGGGGSPNVDVFAFAADKDQFLPDIPIDSVTPPAAWVPGSHTVDTSAGAVTIFVKASVSGDAGAVFDGFVQNGGNVIGKELAVPKGVSDFAIVIYGANPCQVFVDQVDLFQSELDDCENFHDCTQRIIDNLKKGLATAQRNLAACEAAHRL